MWGLNFKKPIVRTNFERIPTKPTTSFGDLMGMPREEEAQGKDSPIPIRTAPPDFSPVDSGPTLPNNKIINPYKDIPNWQKQKMLDPQGIG